MKQHKIQWLNLPGYKGETWNPIAGCGKVSEGCANCYAERMAVRLAGMALKKDSALAVAKYAIVTIKFGNKNGWNGLIFTNNDEMVIPLKWNKPRVVFVCSMGDLFHENTSDESIDKVMAIAALLPKHIFIVLTKRAGRMAEYFGQGKEKLVKRWEDAVYELGISEGDDPDSPACYLYNRCMSGAKVDGWGWPLTNVWLGVTAENQVRANERVPYLLQVPAAVRFVSVEPILGPVDLTALKSTFSVNEEDYLKFKFITGKKFEGPKIDWVICGGESGHNARPVHPDWVRGLRDQCVGAGVPFFFKQWGEWAPLATVCGKQILPFGEYDTLTKHGYLKKGKKARFWNVLDGKKWEEWPEIIKEVRDNRDI